MEKLKLITGVIGAALGGFAGWFWGPLEGALIVLVALICIDYITGLAAAFYNHEVSSEVGFRGIVKKIVLLLMAGVANILDVNMLKGSGVLRDAALFFFIANEGISIIENVGRMGIDVPKPFKGFFNKLKDKGDGDNG